MTQGMDLVEETWLSERESELFGHRYREGKKIRVCAEEMDIEVNTVKSMLGTMREKLRKSENTVEVFEEVENT